MKTTRVTLESIEGRSNSGHIVRNLFRQKSKDHGSWVDGEIGK